MYLCLLCSQFLINSSYFPCLEEKEKLPRPAIHIKCILTVFDCISDVLVTYTGLQAMLFIT